MKIRGTTITTPMKPEAALVKCKKLTEEQKTQARENIGAASETDYLRLAQSVNGLGQESNRHVRTIQQNLSDLEKKTARANIGAAKEPEPMTVSIDANRIANHSASEICYHVVGNSGGVHLIMNGAYIAPSYVSKQYVDFECYEPTTRTKTVYRINNDRTVRTYKQYGTANVDDSKVGADPWSSKNTVDKLCPPFTATGTIVTCEPVEGYPLEVEEYAHYKTVDCSQSSSELRLYVPDELPLGTYRVYDSANNAPPIVREPSWETMHTVNGKYSEFEVDDRLNESVIAIQPNEAAVNPPVYVIERKVTKIFRTGKNLVNSNVLDANNVTWHKYSAETRYRYYLNLAPGTYTASVKRIGTELEYLYLVSNFNGSWEENVDVISGNNRLISGSGTERTCTFNVRGGESVALYAVDNNVSSFVEWIQVEAGSPKTAYEPYQGGEFSPGEEIPALQGVNSIWADVGEITVTGRKDPVAIIDKLTNAILSLGGNV
jgi:hypothetical protein